MSLTVLSLIQKNDIEEKKTMSIYTYQPFITYFYLKIELIFLPN